eukprot:TRINITY_DN32493_c0_g1_i1.p1 TRINITY_DN32493_c0_g1~~TRINITY_DN32493_c0_g1_i1.p1  ORF type:complete len:853 (+),score=345.53 TRINITY_DN32493_c0_g1_i1:73-2559(+)
MAEARLACHPVPGIGLHQFRVDPSLHSLQAAVTGDGVVFYVPHPRFLWRNFVRFVHESRNLVQTMIWPMSGKVYTAVVLAFVALVQFSPSDAWLRSGWIAALVWYFDSMFPLTHLLPVSIRVGYLAFLWGILVGLLVCMFQRLFLRGLLSYHGWMTEGRKPSLPTKVWGFLLKYCYVTRGFLAGKPLLYAYQGALPSLPLPSLEDTLKTWLQTVRPLLTDDEFRAREVAAKDFTLNVGPQLQRYLKLRHLVARNYVSDWWMRFVYLRGRGSIYINSNFYIMDNAAETPEEKATDKQLCRAAVLIYYFLHARRNIDHERLTPLLIQNLVPICMDQYSRAFNCTRLPGKDEDVIRTWPMDEARHILVTYKGRMYTLTPYTRDSRDPLPPSEIMRLLEGITGDKSDADASDASKHVAALTTLPRTQWATIREDHFQHNRHNRTVLDQIERAMFHVALDDRTPESWQDEARWLFMGNGSNLWCDKSFTCVVFANARAGLHTEHTWADAPVIAHLWEWILAAELRNAQQIYKTDGSLDESVSPAKRLKWQDVKGGWRKEDGGPGQPSSPKRLRMPQKLMVRIPTELEKEIMAARDEALRAMDDLDLAVRKFDSYGKGLVKKAGVSPDAWVQMALQLAYYRDQDHFDLTYESSMTRLYKYGRTETIRSCSVESCAWVRAMADGDMPVKEKLALLRKAGGRHQQNSHQAMLGHGVDRHLFGLYVVSVGKSIDAPFLKDALSMPFRLSTSQVPQRQTPKGTWPGGDMGDKYYCPGGCFGPVADDGYGVCYGIVGEGRFLFHVSSKAAAKNTGSQRFMDAIFKALHDMGSLVRTEAG